MKIKYISDTEEFSVEADDTDEALGLVADHFRDGSSFSLSYVLGSTVFEEVFEVRRGRAVPSKSLSYDTFVPVITL